uniref:Clathrin assembly protein n=1 Tax=Heterorhabditis bacteriophora TaxID=37862 RepID=A0A1I7XJ59_HETBA
MINVSVSVLLERELARDEAQHVEIVAEIKLVEKAFCDLQTAFKTDEAIKTLKELPDLIRPMARNDLFDDTPLGFPSTSFQQIKSCPSVDPFNGSIAHIDPFAQADPFISTPASEIISLKLAPPPPRPAPPKSTTRQTPINEDPFANTDPQAGNNQSASSGFADFSNFGAFN